MKECISEKKFKIWILIVNMAYFSNVEGSGELILAVKFEFRKYD